MHFVFTLAVLVRNHKFLCVAALSQGAACLACHHLIISQENVAALVAFWAILGGAAVYTGYQYLSKQDKK